MSEFTGVDVLVLGRRVRQLRKARGWTLQSLAERVGRTTSALSMLENGRREPRLSLLQALAGAFDIPLADLVGSAPLDRRAELEIELQRAQSAPQYRSLSLPEVRPGPRLPLSVLEALVGLHTELVRQSTSLRATPEEARRANTQLRALMRRRDNYFAEIEQAARDTSQITGTDRGPLTERDVNAIVQRLGFTLHREADLPHAARSVIDLEHKRIFVPHPRDARGHGRRQVVLQAVGHIVLGHREPTDYADFLRQRVEVNYFAAATLVPEASAVDLLQQGKRAGDIAVEDLRDAFAVSYETAAHRFTNLATRHLGIPVHFMRVHESGTIYKAYENDGVTFPADVTGAIEGQPVCKHWTARAVFSRRQAGAYQQYTDTPNGTYWCTALVESADNGDYSVAVGVPYAQVRWFRGRDTRERDRSSCPDPACCRRPPEDLSRRWEGRVLASARAHTHLLAALPPGTFPGVDDTEILAFLDARPAPPASVGTRAAEPVRASTR